jgi:protein involved in polysaccharide export with SLBB domain
LSRCPDACRLRELINMMLRFGQKGMCALVLLMAVLWGGCQMGIGQATPQTAPATGTNGGFSIDRIAVGDVIRVMYEASVPIAPTEIQVPETGLVTIHMGEQVQVAGKMAADVSKDIRDLLTVKKQMYKRLSVNVQVLGRTFSVGGEVRTSGSFPFDGGMTVLKAINRAGGFTEYANRREVRVTRVNGQQVTVDCKAAMKKPELDIPLYPGDRIEVVRSIL